MRDAAEIARRSAEALWREDAASRDLGIEILEVGPGRARLAMTVTERMVNGFGNCHGGYIFTLADAAFAVASQSYGQRALGEHCTVSYLSPGRLGMRMTAEAHERSRARRSGSYDVTVRDEAGGVIAEFLGHSRVTGRLLDPEDS
jgi:acyl-CoA thioesterase